MTDTHYWLARLTVLRSEINAHLEAALDRGREADGGAGGAYQSGLTTAYLRSRALVDRHLAEIRADVAREAGRPSLPVRPVR